MESTFLIYHTPVSLLPIRKDGFRFRDYCKLDEEKVEVG